MKRVALRESACGIGLMVDDIERVAAGIESKFKVRGLERSGRISARIQWPAQCEFLDLNGMRGIGQREHTDAVRGRIGCIKEVSTSANQRPAWAFALNGDGTGKAQITGAVERERTDLTGAGESGVDDVPRRVLCEAQKQAVASPARPGRRWKRE